MERPGEPAVYIHGHHESVLRSHRRRTVADSAAYLVPVLEPYMKILDIGCGPGTITAGLAGLVPQGQVTGIDPAAGALEAARAFTRERGLDNVCFSAGNVQALEFADGSFDVVHAHQVLQYLGDPVSALREMRRVCKPGGFIAVRDADYAAMSWYPQVPGLEEWRSLYQRVARSGGGEPDAGRRLLSWAQRAGLPDITATASAWCYATAEDRAWWSGLWADRAVATEFATLAAGGGHTDWAGLKRVSAAWQEWGQHEDAWFTILNSELLCRV
ncbi:class I SAM-dependent methyltransferase [Streptomyces sp. UNOC14_S4]|uniref:class I SAM-dependent methyltransferase n=1 Tax=Streptomyces sp. UNOC14_S4 TaxID=2872340 RepID=UPI001E6086D7|nr:class I SAM-dependent methyltransferase [Streptomyces sp. UNOC14_S4]MCC3769170.1 class I SAM-dependent methyltransferase [Streptomyces sp. UNOC14_S4]